LKAVISDNANLLTKVQSNPRTYIANSTAGSILVDIPTAAFVHILGFVNNNLIANPTLSKLFTHIKELYSNYRYNT
jgi:hypothetical protein